MVNKFKNCPECDFEWHSSDGLNCPVCNSRNRGFCDKYEGNFYKSGLFGTGKSKLRIGYLYQTLGILVLVYFLYSVFGGD